MIKDTKPSNKPDRGVSVAFGTINISKLGVLSRQKTFDAKNNITTTRIPKHVFIRIPTILLQTNCEAL